MFVSELQNYRPFSELIADAGKAGDSLDALAGKIRAGDRSERTYVLHNIATKSSIQIQIALRDAADPNATQMLAFTARNLYELNLYTRLVFKSDEDLERFMNERAKDEIEILEGLLIAVDDPDSERWDPWNERISQLNEIMNKHDRELMQPMNAHNVAGRVGLLDEHKAFYKLYSKYSHMSSWVVTATKDHSEGFGYRNILAAKILQYAEDTAHRIAQFLKTGTPNEAV